MNNMKDKVSATVVRDDLVPRSFEKAGPEHVNYNVQKIRGMGQLTITIPGKPIKTFLVRDRVNQNELNELCCTYDITVLGDK